MRWIFSWTRPCLIRPSPKPFNLCRLIAGSEGTLFFGTEFELDCDPLPPPHSALLCAHFETIDAALRSVIPALNHQPFGVELLDRFILEATKRNLEQQKNRFFVEGDPGAILVVDIRREDAAEVDRVIAAVARDIQAAGYGYAFPVLKGADEAKVWDLRRAGQGLVSNVPGDEKPREVCEDTAVDVAELADYIAEFDSMLKSKHGKECVYYAHAGSGELHTRPLFDLKTEAGLKTFRSVAEDVAALVKKYRGSLSGEHGDGRLRGEFIPFMVGQACYGMMQQVKQAFDPEGVFNPGKIIDTPPMDTHLRHGPGHSELPLKTVFDFSSTRGMLRAIENCNGSGDCRKGPLAGGTMCPSYMATRSEKDTTRARANILRHALTHPKDARNVFENDEAHEVLDLCLSCKGCKSECPSNVDMAKLKAEFLQHSYDARGVPLRAKLVANFSRSSRWASRVPWVWNALFGTPWSRRLLNRMVGFHPDRTIPRLHATTVERWARRRGATAASRRVYLFCDEFTNYSDTPLGQKAILLLERLGYEVLIPGHLESARTWLSKGLVRKAKAIANENVRRLADLISEETPLIGIEPSAILGFRDEYIDLAEGPLQARARSLAKNCLLFDEFMWREHAAGRIRSGQFVAREQRIVLHGHCFQKALGSNVPTINALQIPTGYTVEAIPSGCCGMAGSFGYEKEHYALSMQIGELVLFPAVREQSKE
jgi:Fe-S oxidoreductase